MFSSFEQLESNVRFYCRDFPALFECAEGPFLITQQGERYIDFLCGAGTLNYGHNHPLLKTALIDYLSKSGIIHSLDLYTSSKYRFLTDLNTKILAPRRLDYKVQFTGPTGTNAVEAALKLARKVTGRSAVVAFTNAFHGVSLGALAVSSSASKRAAAGVPLDRVIRLPYEGFLDRSDRGDAERDASYVEAMLTQPGSGLEAPAAIILETIQGEGGLQMASKAWIQRIAALAKRLGALLIVDDIQAGCGRTGTFFSFEPLGITPDLICLSKSLSGIGLPLSVLLIAPQHDCWKPGEHNGTFRGNNMAFVTGQAALQFWESPEFLATLERNIGHLDRRLRQLAAELGLDERALRGRGMIRGLELGDAELASRTKHEAFRSGLLVETCGPQDTALKLLPPLNIETAVLDEGLQKLHHALASSFAPARAPSKAHA